MTNKRMCYYVPVDSYVEGRGFRVSVVEEGVAGHTPTGEWPNDGTGVLPYFWGRNGDYEEAVKQAEHFNKKHLGLSKKDVHEIVTSSIGAQIRETPRARNK